MTKLREALRRWWRSTRGAMPETAGAEAPDTHLDRAADSLRALLADDSIPRDLRDALAADYAEVEAMLDRLEHGQVHLAVFGRVSVGKSALANALLGEPAFAVSVLHGTTREATPRAWREVAGNGVHLIDTPGIDELDGEAREQLAMEVASISDLVVFVVDADMTTREHDALVELARTNRPLLLALNKADRYSESETERLLERLREHAQGLVQAENVVAVSALPPALRRLSQGADGREREELLTQTPDIAALQARLLDVLGREGRTLSALNASLFAGRLSDAVGKRIVVARRELAAKVIRQYCIAKSLAVALNPIPVADLLAAGALDAALVMHLARVYGLPLTQREAGGLIATICAQLVALMGAIWGVHLVASALKGLSAGMSTVLTATAQGALAWYATLIVGQAADRYLAAGKSWGELGAKRVVSDIVESLDRDSILREARSEILKRLRTTESNA